MYNRHAATCYLTPGRVWYGMMVVVWYGSSAYHYNHTIPLLLTSTLVKLRRPPGSAQKPVFLYHGTICTQDKFLAADYFRLAFLYYLLIHLLIKQQLCRDPMLTPRSTRSTPILKFNQPIVCFVNTEEQRGCLNESRDSSDSSISEDEEIEGQPIPTRPRNSDGSRLKWSVHRHKYFPLLFQLGLQQHHRRFYKH